MDLGDLDAVPQTGHFGPVGGSAAAGVATSAFLDHRLLGFPLPEHQPGPATMAWLDQVIAANADAALRGVTLEGLPTGWIPHLRRVGLPLAPAGEWRWGRELKADTRLERPELRGDRLALPGPQWLAACNAVALKPVRRWMAQHIGVRLQAAPGIHVTCWANQAILVSTREEVLGGFLHGPDPQQRQTLAWESGQALWVRW